MRKAIVLFIGCLVCSCQTPFGPKEQSIILEYEKSKLPKPGFHEMECADTIDFDVSSITDLPAFKAKFDNHFFPSLPARSVVCSTSMEYMNAQEFGKNDLRKERLAEGLRTYGKQLCYKTMNEKIHCVHHIQYKSIVEMLDNLYAENPSYFKQIDFEDIVNKLKNENVTDYTTDYYNHYIALDKSTLFGVSINVLKKFDPEKHCFSLPFLKIIVDRYSADTDGDSIKELPKIMVIKDRQTSKKLFVAVQDSQKKNHYYDFSQIPHSNPTIPLHYSFSPL